MTQSYYKQPRTTDKQKTLQILYTKSMIYSTDFIYRVILLFYQHYTKLTGDDFIFTDLANLRKNKVILEKVLLYLLFCIIILYKFAFLFSVHFSVHLSISYKVIVSDAIKFCIRSFLPELSQFSRKNAHFNFVKFFS